MKIKLQTNVPVLGEEPKIDYFSKIILMGSCFSETIGEKLRYFKFDALSNPFGVIFNPYSLKKLIERAVQEHPFQDSDVFEYNGLWRSFEVHSQWVRSTKGELLNDLNTQRFQLQKVFKEATHIIITLGSAWVYRYKKTDTRVANCHKVPGTEFDKELMDVSDIIQCLSRIESLMKGVNPELKLIFTVSPVRHIKDGFVENNRSKGRLLDAVHAVVETSSATYFPSFEIVMDELRDYRFYADDLLHPNALGVSYIWEKFQQAWVASSVQPLMDRVAGIQKKMAHRPMNPELPSAMDFRKNLEEEIESLRKQVPHIKF